MGYIEIIKLYTGDKILLEDNFLLLSLLIFSIEIVRWIEILSNCCQKKLMTRIKQNLCIIVSEPATDYWTYKFLRHWYGGKGEWLLFWYLEEILVAMILTDIFDMTFYDDWLNDGREIFRKSFNFWFMDCYEIYGWSKTTTKMKFK